MCLGSSPSSGNRVDDCQSAYIKTPDELPAVNLKWKSTSIFSAWSSPKSRMFCFAREALMVGELSDEEARSAARVAGMAGAVEGIGPYGRTPLLLAGLAAATGVAAAKTKNIKAIEVLYKNEEELIGLFIVVSDPETIGEILASVPPNIIAASKEAVLEEWRQLHKTNGGRWCQ